jgi:hypothetical protein
MAVLARRDIRLGIFLRSWQLVKNILTGLPDAHANSPESRHMLFKQVTKRSSEASERPTFSVDLVENQIVKAAVSYWYSVRGQRRLPARSDLTLRGMASFIPYTLIVAVIEGGADYEYKFVGEVERQQFGRDFKGMRVSAVEKIAPKFGSILRATYDRIRSMGSPFAVRGLADHEPHDIWRPYHETAFLPLGVTDEIVDHFLAVSVNVPRPRS